MAEHYTVRRVAARNDDIRARKAAGENVTELAERFDLSVAMIYRITNKRI